jgi:hypothetical protein
MSTLTAAYRVVDHRDGGVCVWCGNRAAEHHHRYRRGMGGSSDPQINDPRNLLSACAFHHRLTESQRTVARDITGWCVPTLGQAFTTPVLTLWGWRLPTAGGTWLPIGPKYTATSCAEAEQLARRLGLITEGDDQ